MRSLSAHIGVLFAAASVAHGHLAAWHPSMYCAYGPTGQQDLNAQSIVNPLYQLNFDQWWFHHVDNCDQFPPPDGTFLELPAGGSFTVEIASNRAKTSLSYNGSDTSEWPDGNNYPEDYNVPTCITSPNMHTQNQSQAAGTAFAISYQSDITKVTPDNLAVFSVRYHTPWKRLTTYDIPAAMPACPPDGCICAWGWIPNGCGQPNMYHQGFKCNVTGATSTTPIAPPQPPVWCEDDPSKCVQGSKQMLYWNQAQGDNIEVSGSDLSGEPKSPAYNAKCGFSDGAQNDIFGGTPQAGPSSAAPSASAAQSTLVPSSTQASSTISSSSAASTPAPSSNPATAGDNEEDCDDGSEDDEDDTSTDPADSQDDQDGGDDDGDCADDEGDDEATSPTSPASQTSTGEGDDDEDCDDGGEPEDPSPSASPDGFGSNPYGGADAYEISGSSDPSPPSASVPTSNDAESSSPSSPASSSNPPSTLTSGGGYPGLCPPRNSQLRRRKSGMSLIRRIPLSYATPEEMALKVREDAVVVLTSSGPGPVARALHHARRFGYGHHARGWEARGERRGSGGSVAW